MKKSIFIILFFLTLGSTNPEKLKEFPIDKSEEFFDLSGEWYFINANDFINNKTLEEQKWISVSVPGLWRTQDLLGIREAYYYLPIKIHEDYKQRDMALFSTGFLGTEEIYFNGKLIGKTADITKTREESTFTARPDIYTIPKSIIKINQKNDLVFRVSDHLNMGGFPNTLYFGEYSILKKFFFRNMVTKVGLSLIFFSFSIYFFLFFWDYKRDKSLLLFSLLMFLYGCFVISVERYLFWIHDGFYLYYYLLNVPMSTLSVLYIFLGYTMYNIKPDRFDKILLSTSIPMIFITILIGIGQIPEVILFRNKIFYKVFFGVYWCYLIPLFKLLFTIYKNKYFSYRLILIGAFALLSHALLATLTSLDLFKIKSWYFGEFNLVMIISMSLVLSKKYSIAQKRVIEMEKKYRKELLNEVKEKTKELTSINKELMVANLTKNKLFSVLSHDLRSPLSLLNEVMKLTHRKKISQSSFKKHIEKISEHTERNMLFLENLLNWSSSQLYQLKPEKTEIDLNLILQESIYFWADAANNKKIKFQYTEKPNSIGYSDKNMIRIILNNLINNAIKFSRMNSSIYLNLKEEGSEFQIDVIDSGDGIDPDLMRDIFLLKQSKIKKGTANEIGNGLGLVMVKDFINDLDEKIFYCNKNELGSKFTFTVKKHD